MDRTFHDRAFHDQTFPDRAFHDRAFPDCMDLLRGHTRLGIDILHEDFDSGHGYLVGCDILHLRLVDFDHCRRNWPTSEFIIKIHLILVCSGI